MILRECFIGIRAHCSVEVYNVETKYTTCTYVYKVFVSK